MGQLPPKPNNYLVWSILTTLFCCLPLGIVAIIQSAKVDGLYSTGQFAAAEQAAADAKKWITWGVALAVVGGLGYLVLLGLLAAFGSSSSTSTGF